MIKTFDFVFKFRNDYLLRNEVYRLMSATDNKEMDILGWHLFFDQKRRLVTITDNGTDESLKANFIPAEIEYESLMYLLDGDRDSEDFEFHMNYLI